MLSPEEITRMIEAAPNLMHRTILMLLYGTGMRRTEASLVKVSDIESERMVIHVQQGKGSRVDFVQKRVDQGGRKYYEENWQP